MQDVSHHTGTRRDMNSIHLALIIMSLIIVAVSGFTYYMMAEQKDVMIDEIMKNLEYIDGCSDLLDLQEMSSSLDDKKIYNHITEKMELLEC